MQELFWSQFVLINSCFLLRTFVSNYNLWSFMDSFLMMLNCYYNDSTSSTLYPWRQYSLFICAFFTRLTFNSYLKKNTQTSLEFCNLLIGSDFGILVFILFWILIILLVQFLRHYWYLVTCHLNISHLCAISPLHLRVNIYKYHLVITPNHAR